MRLPFTRKPNDERDAIRPTISADQRSAIMREALEERLATYIVRSAVHRGKRITSEYLRAYADLLMDNKSEFSQWIDELQEEADRVLG